MITNIDSMSNYIEIENKRIHYLSAGTGGKTILLIHGWPTSAYLWRNIITLVSQKHRVIALDLPGFGKSDKSIEAKYTYEYHAKIINGLLEKLQIESIVLGVHDLGGPVALTWMINNQEKVNALVIFNTLVYIKFSWAVATFFLSTYTPFVKRWLTSKSGLAFAMRFGVQNKKNITTEILENYQSPFATKNNRKVLIKTIHDLQPNQFSAVQKAFPSLKIPICGIYGENDRILPDIERTMMQVKQDVPHAEIHKIANCGHFLQEDEPEKISMLLLDFLEKHNKEK